VKIRLTRSAKSEIQAIYERLATESPLARDRFEQRLSLILRDLRDFPESGRATDIYSLRVKNSSPYPYLIFYRLFSSEIVVISVRHGARDPRSMPGRSR
jgi:toxin ParE1/3/4